jgi:hypothetical protein
VHHEHRQHDDLLDDDRPRDPLPAPHHPRPLTAPTRLPDCLPPVFYFLLIPCSTPVACRRPASGPPASCLGCPARFIWQVEEGGSSAQRWTPLPRKPRREPKSGPETGRRPVDLQDQQVQINMWR